MNKYLLIGIRFGRRGRRFYIKRELMWFVGGSIGIIESRVEGVGILEFAAQVHGEFEFPAHGFDNVGGGDFIPVCIAEGDFDVGAFLKGGDFEVDAEAAAIGIWLGGKGGNLRFFGDCAG